MTEQHYMTMNFENSKMYFDVLEFLKSNSSSFIQEGKVHYIFKNDKSKEIIADSSRKVLEISDKLGFEVIEQIGRKVNFGNIN